MLIEPPVDKSRKGSSHALRVGMKYVRSMSVDEYSLGTAAPGLIKTNMMHVKRRGRYVPVRLEWARGMQPPARVLLPWSLSDGPVVLISQTRLRLRCRQFILRSFPDPSCGRAG